MILQAKRNVLIISRILKSNKSRPALWDLFLHSLLGDSVPCNPIAAPGGGKQLSEARTWRGRGQVLRAGAGSPVRSCWSPLGMAPAPQVSQCHPLSRDVPLSWSCAPAWVHRNASRPTVTAWLGQQGINRQLANYHGTAWHSTACSPGPMHARHAPPNPPFRVL